jgi:hypothetical protein
VTALKILLLQAFLLLKLFLHISLQAVIVHAVDVELGLAVNSFMARLSALKAD